LVLQQSCVLTDEGPTAITDDNRPIKIEGEKQKFSKGDTFYSKEKKISFQGGNSDIANGRVKIYEGSSLKKEVTAGSDGKWKASIKVKKSDDYKFKLEYYNASGAKIAESSKYVVKVDDKDPKITDLPLILNKKRGDKIWWKAEDNRRIDEYKISFLGKNTTTKKDSFNVPVNAPRGLHILKVKVYDKAGNSTSKTVTIYVR